MRDHRHRATLLLIAALVAGCNEAPEGTPSNNAPAPVAGATPAARSGRASKAGAKKPRTVGPRSTQGFVD